MLQLLRNEDNEGVVTCTWIYLLSRFSIKYRDNESCRVLLIFHGIKFHKSPRHLTPIPAGSNDDG